jgi:hypothetical protein
MHVWDRRSIINSASDTDARMHNDKCKTEATEIEAEALYAYDTNTRTQTSLTVLSTPEITPLTRFKERLFINNNSTSISGSFVRSAIAANVTTRQSAVEHSQKSVSSSCVIAELYVTSTSHIFCQIYISYLTYYIYIS